MKQGLRGRLLENYDKRFNRSGINGERLASRLSALASIGRTDEGGSFRIGFSKEERQAKDVVKGWMTEAGLDIREDEVGNVFGRLAGKQNELPAVLSGSHVDSVPNGGHFDGTLGVLSALEVVEAWKETSFRPTRPFEVVIFTDEEGARFNGGFIGSEAMVGDLNMEELKQRKDRNGVPFEEVLKENGLLADRIVNAKRNLDDIEAFIEVHIEQGKQLEKANVSTGIVTGIAGPCWLEITFIGEPGHAGSTPMSDRDDALVAAGQFVSRVNGLPQQVSASSVATVGKLDVYPNGVNVIPGKVRLYVDIRDIYEQTRDKLVDLVIETAQMIAEQSGVRVESHETLRTKPIPIKQELQEELEASVKAENILPFYLPSGAAHDSMIVGRHLPVAMLFVRSKDGISHNPKEWSSLNDCISTVHVLKNFVEKLVTR